MKTKLQKTEKGFTIIEVLIVLAIAGLILLIVFLAVPALQRNSRNTQIRNATASVVGAVSEYSSNNNGQLPTTIATDASGKVTLSGGSGTSPAETSIQAGLRAVSGTAMPTSPGQIVVRLGFKCNGNAFGAATPRAIAAGFLIEASGSNPTQCVES